MTERERLMLEYKSLGRIIDNDAVLITTAQRRTVENMRRRVAVRGEIGLIDSRWESSAVKLDLLA